MVKQTQQRRLTGTAGSDDRYELSDLYGKGYIAQDRFFLLIGLADVF